VYHGWYSRFYQPDPWDGSYDLTDPQSFNRYTYVQNDPVNYVDPTGMLTVGPVNGGQLGVVTVRGDAGPDWTALWELWMFGMQMDQRLLPPLVDGPPELPAATLPQIPSGRNEASRELKAVTRAEELLRGNCADFVRSVYNAVLEIAGGTVSPFGITPYPVTFYDLAGKAIPQPTGPDDVLHLYKIALEAGKVSASGRSGGNVVGETVNYNTVRWNKEYYSMSLDEAAVHTIHEAFHQIPNVSDFVLLEAGARVAGIRAPRVKSSSEASRRFNELLFARCGTRR
jgi:hypothetical protein